MKVTLDLEQAVWTQFLTRAYEESENPSEVLGMWMRRAIRQRRTILPIPEEQHKIIAMREKS